jgi:hypothetical protein
MGKDYKVFVTIQNRLENYFKAFSSKEVKFQICILVYEDKLGSRSKFSTFCKAESILMAISPSFEDKSARIASKEDRKFFEMEDSLDNVARRSVISRI